MKGIKLILAAVFAAVCMTILPAPCAKAQETEITIYAIEERWQSFQVWNDFAASDVAKSYTLPEGEWHPYDTTSVVDIDENNNVYPVTTTYYGYQSGPDTFVWMTWKDDIHEYTRERKAYKFEDATLVSDAGDKVIIHLRDYAEMWSRKVIDAYMAENITADMTEKEKAVVCCKYVGDQFDYTTSYSNYVGMVISGGGDCLASSRMLIYMLEKLGIKCTMRDGSADGGAGGGHQNVAANLDGKYYILDAGIEGEKPRGYVMTEWEQPFTYRKNADGTATLIYYANLEHNNRITIPDVIEGCTVTQIAENCFKNDETLEEIVIPNTVKRIESYAFANLKKLKKLDIPDSVESIGAYIVRFSDSVESIHIGKGVTKIATGAFVYAHGLKTLTVDPENETYCAEDNVLFDKDKSTLILYPLGKADDTYQVPESVTTIYQWAFCDVGLLKHLNLPSKLNKIEKEAFYICDGPEDLILPESLTQLEPYSLSNCQIENVVLPSTMKSITSHAFYQATFTTITLPEGLERIEEYGFDNLLGSAYFIMPKSLTYIGDYAFKPDLVRSYKVKSPMEYLCFPHDTQITFGSNVLSDNNWYTILAKENSSAHQYAKANNIPFHALNENGKLTMQDDWFILCNSYGWYSGKPYLPGVVTNFETMPYGLREGRDYTIRYTNNVEPGTATATVQGMGIIEGKWEKNFEIYPASTDTDPYDEDEDASHWNTIRRDDSEDAETSVPKVAAVKGLKIKAGKKKLTVSWKKKAGVSGYQLQISTKKNFRGARKLVLKSSVTKKVCSGLKKKKVYYVRVRAYKTWKNSEGTAKKAYGKWVTLKKKVK